MKRKVITLFLLLTLVFAVGCNKENKQPDPTPTATVTPAPTATSTPTPTPVPENLAKTNLSKLPVSYDTMLSKQPDYTADFHNGIGYDMKVDVSINSELLSILGISGLETVSLTGSLDYKDTFAGNFALLLNEDEALKASVLTDFNNVFFNLPKYSSQYAGTTLAELTGTEEELPINMSELPTDAEVYDMLRTYLTRFVDCFQPQLGIENNVTIGTGDYVITGDKHTVIAPKEDLLKLLEDLEAEFSLETEDGEAAIEMPAPESSESTSTCLILNYYAGADNSYAWEILTDSPDSEPIVFVSAPNGFCLYGLTDDVPEIILYSIATTENEGTLYIPGNLVDEEADSTETPEDTEVPEILGEFEYDFDDTSCTVEGYFDTVEISVDYSVKNDTVEFDYDVVVEGISISMQETATKNHVEAEITLASYGMKLGSVNITTDLRDYVEVSVPQNSVDMETWEAGLDMETFGSDLLALTDKYPFLMDLLFPSEEEDPNGSEEWDDPYADDETREPFVAPEGYTNDFMNMTGYYVDADGYVDFTPLEAEVLAAGKPSTGFASAAVTDAQKQALLDLCAGLFTDYYYDVETYYSVWGSIEWDMVKSYYQTEHYFSDNNDYNSFIFLNFDAISGDFVDMSIYTSSSEKSIQVANDVLAILGVDGTVTAEDLTNYVVVGNYLLYGYGDETTYGVGIEVYEDYE